MQQSKHLRLSVLFLVVVTLVFTSCAPSSDDVGRDQASDRSAMESSKKPGGTAKMRLHSDAFTEGGTIPKKYICNRKGGENLSPPLAWQNVPDNAMSLALVMHDPHKTAKNWVHWLLIDMAPQVTNLPEGIPNGASVSNHVAPGGAKQLANTSGITGYFGPCPPDPPHPYVFTLYALDAKPEFKNGASYQQILEDLKSHVITSASLTGYF